MFGPSQRSRMYRIGFNYANGCLNYRERCSRFRLETCQGSVPESIIGFLESTDYEDAIW